MDIPGSGSRRAGVFIKAVMEIHILKNVGNFIGIFRTSAFSRRIKLHGAN